MSDEAMDARVAGLERRMLRVEGRLGLVPMTAGASPMVSWFAERRRGRAAQVAAAVAQSGEAPTLTLPRSTGRGDQRESAPQRVAVKREEGVVAPPPLPVQVVPVVEAEGTERAERDLAGSVSRGGAAGLPGAGLPSIEYAAPKAPAPVRQSELEQTLGLKWAGWIGAVVLVIGAGLGIKYAYDQEWFGALPDGLKLVLMSLGGFGLIGAGEWVYRRVNKLSAVGLYGAGVAVLFLVSYAGHGFYQLYARDTAFALMGVSTLVGAAVARRGDLVSIGVLSLIGGNLAPIVLNTGHPSLPAFFAYLAALQVVALALAAMGRAGKWWTLRGVSLASNALWVGAVLQKYGGAGHWTAEVVFLAVSAGMYHLELVWSSLTAGRGSHEGAKGAKEAAKGEAGSVAAAYAVIVTVGFVAGVLTALADASAVGRGSWVLGTAAVSAVLGFGLPRRGEMAALKVAHRVMAAGLLVVAVPVLFTGLSVEVGWGLAALAFAVVATAIDSNLSRAGAVVCWGLTAFHLVTRAVDPFTAREEKAVWVTLFGTGIPAYLVLAAGLLVIGQMVAYLIARKKVGQQLAVARGLSVMASLLFGGAAVAGLPTLGATLAWIGLAWFLVVVDVTDERLAAVPQGVAALLFATAKWVLVDLLGERMSAAWTPGDRAALLTPAMGVGVVAAASLVGLYFVRRRSVVAWVRRMGSGDHAERDAGLGLFGAVLVLMTIGLTFEIDRVVELAERAGRLAWPAGQLRQLLWTMLWSGAACAQMAVWGVVGREDVVQRQRWARGIAWVPVLLLVKFAFVDVLWSRAWNGAAPGAVVANLQMLAGVFVAATVVALRQLHGREGTGEAPSSFYRASAGILMALGLFMGWVEIDRAFEHLARSGAMAYGDAMLAKQVAASIFNAVTAVTAVALGFRLRVAKLRYAGLMLFGVTVVKVFLVDLSHAAQGYRVLSFIGLGALLLGTSVLYGRVSPRWLGDAGSGT